MREFCVSRDRHSTTFQRSIPDITLCVSFDRGSEPPNPPGVYQYLIPILTRILVHKHEPSHPADGVIVREHCKDFTPFVIAFMCRRKHLSVEHSLSNIHFKFCHSHDRV